MTSPGGTPELLAEAARRLRDAAEFLPNLGHFFRGVAHRMEMQDLVDYDDADRLRIERCARALLGDDAEGKTP